MPFVFALLVALLVGFVVGAITFLPRRRDEADPASPSPHTPTPVPTYPTPLALPYTPLQTQVQALPEPTRSPAYQDSTSKVSIPLPAPDDDPDDIDDFDALYDLDGLFEGGEEEEIEDYNDEDADPWNFSDPLLDDLFSDDDVNKLLDYASEKSAPAGFQKPDYHSWRKVDSIRTSGDDDSPPAPIPALEELAILLQDALNRRPFETAMDEEGEVREASHKLAADDTISTRNLLLQLWSDHKPTVMLALNTLLVRADPAVFDFPNLLRRPLRSIDPEIGPFTLQMLSRSAGCSPRTPEILRLLDDRFLSDLHIEFLTAWLRDRLMLEGKGFIPLTAEDLVGDPERQSTLASLLAKLPRDLAEKVAPDQRTLALSEEQKQALVEVGTLYLPNTASEPPPPPAPHLIRHELIDHAIKISLQYLTRPDSRPVLLVGEQGMGNSTTLTLLSHELDLLGYAVFEASATEVMANQKYVGQIEGRIRQLVDALSLRRAVWVIDRFHDFTSAGMTDKSNTSLLDLLLPCLRSGEIRVIAKTSSAGLQALSTAAPRLSSLFKIVRLRSPHPSKVTPIVQQWAANHPGNSSLRPQFPDAVIEEAHQLVSHFFPSRHAPGNVIELLQLTWEHQLSETTPSTDKPATPPSHDDLPRAVTVTVTEKALLTTLAHTTGMPLELLDPRATLDVPALKAHFARHILGQPEAVGVLIDRVIMLKAGLTDPSRPLGVFLFAGPTGTGKTQIAKTLTSYLFGSPDRMIRLDMSEFIHSSSLARLLGHGNSPYAGPALIDHIQRQPFSLILLDEFEKAAPDIWDLFLQVFDEGRLTSWTGEVVDFRNTIIILTSNLGAAAARQAGLGFSSTPQDSDAFRPESIHQSISLTFRPEFLNRLDRVVVFRPLDRPIMRKILVHDLDAILRRRGLRNRGWHFEWDESAVDFLLDRGFTRDLGARPLRRAIDEHVLTQLSAAIVAGQAPADATTVRVAADPSGESLTVDFLASPPTLPQASTPPN
jgi:ATP-dependent Clp protease ATP-binding subunit ClpA